MSDKYLEELDGTIDAIRNHAKNTVFLADWLHGEILRVQAALKALENRNAKKLSKSVD